MDNLRIDAHFVKDGPFPLEFDTGKALIDGMVSHDGGARPSGIVIEATTDDGITVRIAVPYGEERRASVRLLMGPG